AENAGYSYHGGGGPPYDSRLATQTVAEFYPRRSKPNLDKSGADYARRIQLLHCLVVCLRVIETGISRDVNNNRFILVHHKFSFALI
ncbi:MAG: hypothetical protein ABSG23_05910, partial [Terriglobales bacterium]